MILSLRHLVMAFVMEKPVLVLDELEEQMAVVHFVQELFQN